MRLLPLAVAVAVVLAGATACDSDEEPDPKEVLTGSVHIGVNADVPGFSEYTPAGVWEGFDISLIRWLGEDIGFTPQFSVMTVAERMTKLIEASEHPETATVTMVIANFSMDDERRKLIDMAGPYFNDAQGILTTDDSELRTLSDFDGKQLCVTLGSTNEDRIPRTKAIPAPAATLTQCVLNLKSGEMDLAGISSDVVLLEGLARHHEGLRLADIRFGSESYGIGIPNNRPKLCEFLKKRLKKFIDNEWEQKVKDNLDYIDTRNRKPNSDGLTPCEKSSSKAAAVPDHGAATLNGAVRQVVLRRRETVRLTTRGGDRRRRP